MAKQVQSWTKPDGIENLIAIKKIDYSIFSPGSIYISRRFKSEFLDANQGFDLNDGDVKKLTLVIDGSEYDTDMRCNYSPNVNGEKKENLQIRYDGNSTLKQLLMREFTYSDEYIKNEQKRNGKTSVKIPEDVAEYIEFYKTDKPFRYEVKLIKGKAQMMGFPFRNIFTNSDEVKWTFAFIRKMLNEMGITEAISDKYSITLPEKESAIHVNYQAWRVFAIKKRENSGITIEIACKDQYFQQLNINRIFDFKQSTEEDSIGIYSIGFNDFKSFEEGIIIPMNDTWQSVHARFVTSKRTQYLNSNVPDLAEAIFDDDILEYLIENGLDNAINNLDENVTPISDDNFIANTSSYKEIYEAEDNIILSNVVPQEPIMLNPSYTLQQCVEELGIIEETVGRWINAIERKGQAILYGSPGTGKTYSAQRLAKLIVAGGDGIVETIQFHPAYAYEDFIMGIRPTTDNGVLSYKPMKGRFFDFCERSREKKGNCVFIIDEINRANLSRVFGELMYLLEYRNSEIPLSNGDTFSVPKNVYLIGTMNTADRSIAIVDHAFRRRFAFLKIDVNFDVLEKFHQNVNFPIKKLISWLIRINEAINDKRYSVGISFFLRENLLDHIQDIWEMEIIPYLEEYFFDQLEMVDTFSWDRVEESFL